MTGGPRGGSRRGRILRLSLLGLGIALVLVAVVVWFVRDSPRRWLEGRLADELDADVSLGGLEIVDQRHYVLTDLVLRGPSYEPRLARVSIERLEVDAPIREVLRARYERLVADGVEVRLAPTDREAVPAPESTTLVRELEVRRGRIVVEGPAGTSELSFTAHVEDFGTEPRGTVALTGQRVELGPWLALFVEGRGAFRGAIAAPVLELEIGSAPVLARLTGHGESVTLGFGEREIGLGSFSVEASATQAEAGAPVRVEARPVFDGVESAFLVLDVDRDTLLLQRGAAELSGISLSSLLSAGDRPLAPDLEVEGLGRIAVDTQDGSTFSAEVEAQLALVAAPFGARRLEARDARALVTCEWRRGETLLGCALEGGAVSGAIDGTALPLELRPLQFGGKGELELGEATQWDGALQLRAPGVGSVDARGVVRAREDREIEARLEWSWSRAPGASALRRTLARFGYALPDTVELEGLPRAQGTFEGLVRDPALRARVDVAQLGISTRFVNGLQVALGSGSAHALLTRAAGAGAQITVEGLETRGELRLLREGAKYSAPLLVSLHGAFDGLSGEASIEDGAVILGDLARGNFSARLDEDNKLTAHATLDPVQLEQARAPARLWLDDPAPGYALAGTLAGTFDGERRADGKLHASGRVQLDQLGFSSDDGSRVVQGGKAGFSIDLEGDAAGAIEGRATGDLVGPVLLWGTLFGDYSGFTSRVELGGRYDGSRWEATADGSLPEDVRVTGRLAPVPAADPAGGLDYALKVEVPDLGALLETFVQKPFEGSVRAVDRIDAAGRVLVDVAGVLGDARSAVRGNVAIADGVLAGPGASDGVAIGGLDLDLPVDLAWSRESEGPTGEPRQGYLRIEKLRLGGAELPPVRTPLAIAGDTVRLDRPLLLDAFGGRAELEQLALAEWSRASRHLGFGLVLDGLQLEQISDAFGLFPLEGRIDGEFPAVRLTPERLEVAGGGGIDLFGGRVEIFDISGREVLGRYPRLGFSARYSDIHLLDATRTIDFGEIEGVVEGEIRDCELFRGTPVRCAAEMHSVDRPGVSQRISVKAIRNISILGSGNRVGLLDRGLQSFFKNYTYAEIGLEMTLADDRFLLRGTARRGEKELFLKGRLPFRIDIVNVAPGNAVSFQSMLARLSNLEVRPMPPPERERDR